MTDTDKRGEQLDELNKITFRQQGRNIGDRGLAPGDPASALYVGPTRNPDSPLSRGLLEQLRLNAEKVYGDPPRRAPKTS